MIKSFSYYIAPQIYRAFTAFLVSIPITTYYLSAEDFGTYAYLNAILSMCLPLASTGGLIVIASNYFTLEENKRSELIFNALFLDLIIKILILSILYLVAINIFPLIIDQSNLNKYLLYIRILLITSLFSTFWPFTSYLLVIKKKSSYHAGFEFLQISIGLIATVLMFTYLNWGAVSLYLSPLVTSLISLVFEIIFLIKFINFKIQKKTIKQIIVSGLPSIPSGLIEVFSNSTDKIIVEKYLSLAALGIYSHSLNYFALFKTINKAFGRTVNPDLLENFSNSLANFSDLNNKMKVWQIFISIFGFIIIIFIYDVLKLITHDKFTSSAPLVMIWLYFMIIQTLGMAPLQYLIIKKKYKLISFIQIISSIITIGLLIFFVDYYGLIGAGVAILIGSLLSQSFYIFYAKINGCMYGGYKYNLIPLLVFSVTIFLIETIKVNFYIKFLIFCTAILTLLLLVYYFRSTIFIKKYISIIKQ